jgi:hypothetical protein
MQTVTRYIAYDGSEHKTVEPCELRDEIITKVNQIMLPYGAPCTDIGFLNGNGYIQHTKETCIKVYTQLLQLYSDNFIVTENKDKTPYSWVTDILLLPPDYNVFAIDMSWPLRLIDDTYQAEPISKALHRINCTNKSTFKEYGQPFFVNNPAARRDVEIHTSVSA